MTRQEFWDAKSKEAQKREKRVISYLKKGLTRDQIAKKLGISAVRVTNLHSRHILRESRDKNDMYANLTIGTLNALRNAKIYDKSQLMNYISAVNGETDLGTCYCRLFGIYGIGLKNLEEIINWLQEINEVKND